MPVHLYIAPAASGKTHTLLARLRAIRQESPLAPLWVILPDRLQAAAFRRRLAQVSGGIGVYVETFRDLYGDILASAGRPLPVASDTVLHMLLQDTIDELAGRGELPGFAPIHHMPGFVQALRARFVELKQALVYPESLVELAREGPASLAEIARIYEAYQRRLQSTRLADQEGLSWLAVEALETDPRLFNECRMVVLDGFDDFTPVRLRLLQLLAARVPEVCITLPGELGMGRNAHARFRKPFQELVERLDPEVHYLEGTPRLPGPLAHLEANLFENRRPAAGDILNPAAPGPTPLHLLEVRGPADEAREALRWLKALVQRQGAALQDCAIFTQNTHSYYPYLKEAAAEFGIPLHFPWGQSLAETPAVAALVDLLDLPVQDFPRRSTIDAVRSPYFNLDHWGLAPRDAASLELLCLQRQVTGGLDQWREAFESLAAEQAAADIPAPEEDRPPSPHLPQGAERQRLQDGLFDLAARLSPAGEQPIESWIAWLEDLLDELDFPLLCEDEVLPALREALRALLLAESLTGRRKRTYLQFVVNLRQALRSASFYRPIRWHEPAVFVGDMLSARGARFAAVAILGLSEGLLPVVERPDPFLDEAFRRSARLSPQVGRHQAGLFYQAVCRADRYLLLTRPYLAEGGEAWEPSSYWQAAAALFPPEIVTRLNSEAPRPLEDAASPEEAVFWATRQRLRLESEPALSGRLQQVSLGHQVLQARLSEVSQGPYEGCLPALVSELAQRFGSRRAWSASRLETYTGCPHHFFVTHVLALEARTPPEPGFDAAQLGSMLHAILESTFRQAADPADPESVLDALHRSAAAVFRTAPEKYGFRPSPLWDAEQADLLARLQKTVRNLAAESRGWRPVAYELAFGFGRTPALELETAAGPVRLQGIIDRVDRNDAGEIRVVDYKTGSSSQGKGDLIAGQRLQLPLYALAAERALKVGPAVDGLYWSINTARAGSLRLAKFEHEGRSGVAGAAQVAQGHIERALQGIYSARFSPQPPSGGCPSYCPAAAWCWRYQAGFE